MSEVVAEATAKAPQRRSGFALGIKRAIDFVGSGIGLVVLSPLLLMTALVVRTKIGTPVLFRHERPGLNGKPFTLLKFRTMSSARDAAGQLLPDGERMVPAGNLLRRYSLDEFPQLWNVFKGEMSLVGPRPLMMQYLTRYSPEQARRHEMKPGMTGWTQVKGRNALSWDEKFALDVWYVEHWSLGLDLRILLATFKSVVGGRGVSARDHATMPEFMGNERRQGGEPEALQAGTWRQEQ